MTLAGKVALVTGGSRGIGAGIVRRLARDGADVAFSYVSSPDRAQVVAKEVETIGRRALAVEADSADPAATQALIERVVAEFGSLDILVNNAGVAGMGPLEQLTPADIDKVLAVNVGGPM